MSNNSFNNGFNNGFNSGNNNATFARHLCKFIGETVIIFTTSGGLSGCGFTGVILSVNCDFVRLDSREGSAPSCPLVGSVCGDFDNGNNGNHDCNNNNYDYNNNCYENNDWDRDKDRDRRREVGAVCDIPIESIAAFCHNAV